ncbi:TRAP transporter small permease [Salinicola endophyticus]|uniref:TRAP transporter small permease protein n=1 Tax=Salinicola endophyticus TaxID=1949083 RepID=A0AB74UE45_9GAMM
MLSLKRWLERALLFSISTMLVIMVCLMLWQVITRYLLGVPAIYTEETLRFLMIWMALIGSAYCFSTHQHLSLDLIPARLSHAFARVLYLINSLIVLGFAVIVLLLAGWQTSLSNLDQVSPILQIPMGYVYLILPLSAVLIIALQLANLWLVLGNRLPLPYGAAGDGEA